MGNVFITSVHPDVWIVLHKTWTCGMGVRGELPGHWHTDWEGSGVVGEDLEVRGGWW